MSTTTDKLALFKYDPRTDGTQTFNIQKALNDNWDKLDDAAKEILTTLANKAPATHAAQHAKGGADPITPESIGAAPGGYGWGNTLRSVLASDSEDTYETFCGKLDVLLADMPDVTSQLIYVRGPSSTGQYYGAGNIVAVLSKILGTSASLIGLSPDPRGTPNGLWRMLKDNGKWQPVEWINPPMELGTEYRTTERYFGKPVYVKVVDCGKCPESGHKDIQFDTSGVALPIRCYGNWTYDGRSTIPFETTGSDRMVVGIIGRFIRITTGGRNFSERTCTVTVYYTKTTD